jgi:hypothetical protein
VFGLFVSLRAKRDSNLVKKQARDYRRTVKGSPQHGEGIQPVAIRSIRPSPENERIYRPVSSDDPEVISLAESIGEVGVKEPLVVSRDGYILSGHRRYMAARLAGLDQIPVRYEEISRRDEPDRFLALLTTYNKQRVKNFGEITREAAIDIDPDNAYAVLDQERKNRAKIKATPMKLEAKRRRAAITAAKQPFLDAVIGILKQYEEYLPLSERQIHYYLLNDPPLKHASKPGSVYRNDKQSYAALSNLVTRARIEGSIDEDAISDETRPEVEWNVYQSPSDFLREQLNDKLLVGYWRDPMQSQANHIELLVEKNTVANVLRDVASEFGIPMMSGRGFNSLPPRIKIRNRHRASGKEKLVLVIVADFDPSGEWIADTYARSMRDDFGIVKVEAYRAALTRDQVRERRLQSSLDVRAENTHAKLFRLRYGLRQKPYELESLKPDDLRELVRKAIESVMDVKRFNDEIRRARVDAKNIASTRAAIIGVLKNYQFPN